MIHVLLRPLTPRHPPCALSSLTTFSLFRETSSLKEVSFFQRVPSKFLLFEDAFYPIQFLMCQPTSMRNSECRIRNKICIPSSLCFHTLAFWVNISSRRESAQKKAVEPLERRIHILPPSFFMPLSKCYCNYRMGIQDFRPIYTSVFTRFWRRLCENQSPEPGVCTTTSCLASLFSLSLSHLG